MNCIANKYTGKAERYTPAVYIDAARRVLGEIDLDPASDVIAQRTVKAKGFFTKQEDGLRQEWIGRVFLNPPYARGVINLFVGKLIAEYSAGKVTAAILLTNNFTDTKWWHEAARAAQGVCFTKGRIKFYSPDWTIVYPMRGQTFFYFGPYLASFASTFRPFGTVKVIDTVILPNLYVTHEDERAGNETDPPEARPYSGEIRRAHGRHRKLDRAPGAGRNGNSRARGAAGTAALEDQQAGAVEC